VGVKMSRLLILIFFSVIDVAQAANGVRKDVASWNACRETAYFSEEAKRAEYEGGKTGVEDFLVEKCGFRPVVGPMNGKLSLYDGDCAQLFEWSNEGDCDPLGAVVKILFVRNLDPRVFNELKYSERCLRRRSAEGVDDYSAFREQICEAPVKSQRVKEQGLPMPEIRL
jgi:hypothetical protein